MYKIAYCIRPDFETGGDGVQVLKTKEYIEKQYTDIAIDIIVDPALLNTSYVLVHIFNYATHEITSSFFQRAKELGLRIVSSTIFWDYSYSQVPLPFYIKFYKSFISENFLRFHRRLNFVFAEIPLPQLRMIYFEVSRDFRRKIKGFLNDSIFILPNSFEEGQKCLEFAHVDKEEFRKKIRVVLNGADVSDVSILPEKEFFERYKIPHDYILQVGRIEFLKNQLNLISSLLDKPEVPIVILGSSKGRIRELYAKAVKKIAKKRGNVYFVDKVPHEDVYSFYHYAKTHVLLSLRESPGLSSLEALSQGCPIVVSDSRFAPVVTYFKDNCEVTNPLNKREIKEAIMRSYQKPHKKVSLDWLSWANVARDTYNVYKEILG